MNRNFLVSCNNNYTNGITQFIAPGVENIFFGFLGAKGVAVLCRTNHYWCEKNIKIERNGIHGTASLVAFICAKELLNNLTNANYVKLKKLKKDNIVDVFPFLSAQSFTFKATNQKSFELLPEISRDLPNLKALEILRPAARTKNGTPRAHPRALVHDYSGFLTSFTLESLKCHAGDSELLSLSSLPDLKKLDLTGSRFRSDSLSSLSTLSQLKVLNLSFCAIEDAALMQLSSLTGLVQLNLSGNSLITDAGMSPLGSLQNLKHLDLSFCPLLTEKCLEQE